MRVIAVENVSKKFVLAHDRPKDIADAARSLLMRAEREEFWALKDVSFEVEQGEALGIIGHNGAGKSTMLKLLARIMNPTKGRIRTRGHVSALIEVGAGFHPEMTGRENIYLNGSILGMPRREIGRKLDDIVAFAELEKFIDTPVKRYSSGMYARLGFAVMAFLEAEILLVDEVLSVGDERFQLKCQKRMSEMMRSGATVVFISHNLPAVIALCPRSVLLHQGQVTDIGDSSEIVRKHRKVNIGPCPASECDASDNGTLRLLRIRVLDEAGAEIEEVEAGAHITIEAQLEVYRPVAAVNFGIEIERSGGLQCLAMTSSMDGYAPSLQPGEHRVFLRILETSLVEGTYGVSFGVMDPSEVEHYSTLMYATHFTVVSEKLYRGVAFLKHDWHIMEV